MIIPEKVKILHLDYDVSLADNIHDRGGDLLGQVDFLCQKIRLNAGASEEQKRETLLHEIIHAMDEKFRIGLKERQVEQLGVAIYNLVKDNPEMFNDDSE